jgi:hypothetical protein
MHASCQLKDAPGGAGKSPAMPSIRAIATGICSLLACFVIGACGSGGSDTVTVTHTDASKPTSTPATPGTTSTAAATTAAAATTGQASMPACTASMLALSEIGNQGATGHIEVGLALKNSSSGPCHTYGYPGVEFLGKSGAALPTKSTRTTTDFAGTIPLQKLVVAPGDTVSFRMLFEDSVGGGSAGCTTAYGVQVIPPDDTHTMRVTVPNGVPECGTTTVTPLAPGTSAYR